MSRVRKSKKPCISQRLDQNTDRKTKKDRKIVQRGDVSGRIIPHYWNAWKTTRFKLPHVQRFRDLRKRVEEGVEDYPAIPNRFASSLDLYFIFVSAVVSLRITPARSSDLLPYLRNTQLPGWISDPLSFILLAWFICFVLNRYTGGDHMHQITSPFHILVKHESSGTQIYKHNPLSKQPSIDIFFYRIHRIPYSATAVLLCGAFYTTVINRYFPVPYLLMRPSAPLLLSVVVLDVEGERVSLPLLTVLQTIIMIMINKMIVF